MQDQEDECESDDPVEFLEQDSCSDPTNIKELYFSSSTTNQRGETNILNNSEYENEGQGEGEELKKPFSKFSHDINKANPKDRRSEHQNQQQQQQQPPLTSFSSTVSFISKTLYEGESEPDSLLPPHQNISNQMMMHHQHQYQHQHQHQPMNTPPPRPNKGVKTGGLDRPRHWNQSSVTPIRAKRPLSSSSLSSQKTPRKNETTPITPRTLQSSRTQLTFRPNFLKSPEIQSPLLLDPEDVDQSRTHLDSMELSKRICSRSGEVSRTPQNRKFRQGSLSSLFQHILKDQESLELQFSISLPRFPLGPQNHPSGAISIEKSKDLLNPRNRTKYWVDLSLESVGDNFSDLFPVRVMVVVGVSSELLNELTPGSRVQVYFRMDRLQELGINFENIDEKILRVYDFLVLPPQLSQFSSIVTSPTSLSPSKRSQINGVGNENGQGNGVGVGDSHLPGTRIICTQLCEVIHSSNH